MFVASVTVLYLSSRYTQFFYHQLPGILGIAGLAQLLAPGLPRFRPALWKGQKKLMSKIIRLYMYIPVRLYLYIYIPNHTYIL
jgi:hypothetical protein